MIRSADDKKNKGFSKTAVCQSSGRFYSIATLWRAFSFFAVCLACTCTPVAFRSKGFPPTYSYDWISSKKIGFAKPIVVSSEIFYENRFTNQSYHSIDKSRTAEAFYRDFLQKTSQSRLGWREAGQFADSILQRKLAFVKTPLDSLPGDCLEPLRSQGIEVFVCIYAMRLYHMQLVGLRPEAGGSVESYSTIIKKNVDYSVTIIDVAANKPLFTIPIKIEQNNQSLNIMENTVDDLFSILLRNRRQ